MHSGLANPTGVTTSFQLVFTRTKACKIILLGIISKVYLAETSSKTDRYLNHDDEIASDPLSVKSSRDESPALVTVQAL